MATPNDLPELAPLIHQAALNPHLPIKIVDEICSACVHYNFSGFCTDLTRLSAARLKLGSPNQTKLIAVIAFPFGFIPHDLKQAQAEWAAEQGAEELDLVPNFLALSEGKSEIFAEEIARICEKGLPVRVILDMVNLSPNELSLAVEASIDAGVHGLQTGNGFGREVRVSDVQQLSILARGRCEVKAVGGIKTVDHAFKLIEAGAAKIGTSLGPELMQSLLRREQ